MTDKSETTWERFTEAERKFFELLAQIDDLPPYPDEPEVNFIPCAQLKSDLWKAVQAIREEDANGRRA